MGNPLRTRSAKRKPEKDELMQTSKSGARLLGAYLQEMGCCTVEEVEHALEYAADCCKRGRYTPIGQALIELGHTTQDRIDKVLKTQARDRWDC